MNNGPLFQRHILSVRIARGDSISADGIPFAYSVKIGSSGTNLPARPHRVTTCKIQAVIVVYITSPQGNTSLQFGRMSLGDAK
jgi:hypothetical protein